MTKHMVQRSLSFIALAGMLACTGDPTGEFANGVDHLAASPSTFFLQSGATTNIVVTALDGSNNPVTANFSIADVGPGITVERDTEFEPIRNSDGELETNPHPIRVRYIVTATAANGVTSFTISAGGKDIEITSVVTPLVGGAFASTTAAAGDTVVINAASGLRFLPTATIDHGILLGVAGDGSSLSLLPDPGFDGAITVTGAALTALPDFSLTLVTSNTLTVTGSAYAGTDDPLTAPLIALPAVGDSIIIYDAWDASLADQFYAITVATAGNYTITTNWEGSADIDALRCPSTSPGCTAGIGSLGATSAHPESATLDLGTTAGNTGLQKIWVNLYDGAAPVWITVTIKRNS